MAELYLQANVWKTQEVQQSWALSRERTWKRILRKIVLGTLIFPAVFSENSEGKVDMTSR